MLVWCVRGWCLLAYFDHSRRCPLVFVLRRLAFRLQSSPTSKAPYWCQALARMAMLCADRGVCALLGFPADAATVGHALIGGALLILGVLSLLCSGASRSRPATLVALAGCFCGWYLWPRGPPASAVCVQDVLSDISASGAAASATERIDNYELGNLVCRRGAWNACCCGAPCAARMCAARQLTGSIGCRFLRAGVAPANVSALSAAIDNHVRLHHLPASPLPKSLVVVHMRLYDRTPVQVSKLVLQDLSALPAEVTRVVLVGALAAGGNGDHSTERNVSYEAVRASERYVAELTCALRARGLAVEWRLSRNRASAVDEDVAFMRRAAHFVCSTGSFSTLVARLVAHRGGVVHAPGRCLVPCTRLPTHGT